MMLDCLSGFLVGSGIGAYNARELRSCLDATLQVTLQKAGPMFEKAQSKGCDCGPAVEKAEQAVAPYASKAGAALGMAPKPSPNGGWNVVGGSSTIHTTA
ncbi:unnamed protein product [Polarella glacialis]|uniref:Uncharacterized protein n=1 Tax=Polarella glacialis TaxID=89957 RepID=A0A813E350_POLGL|nr:unnamed protein product [Polarella glacialis]